MGLFDKMYQKKYEYLMDKIEELNKKNRKGYATFKEYIMSDVLMLDYFKQLKQLENKYSKLTVDSYEVFSEKVYNQLHEVYDDKIQKIFEEKDFQERDKKLKLLKADINSSYGFNFDKQVSKIAEDIDNKILDNISMYKTSLINKKNDEYLLPSINLLEKIKPTKKDKDKVEEYIKEINDTFKSFKINASVKEVFIGPIFTRFEVILGTKTKVNSITSIKDNLRLVLGADNLSIVYPIDKKNYIAIDIENKEYSNVSFRDVISSLVNKKDNNFKIALGVDMIGTPQYDDITKCSSILIGGSTGTGKSVFINDIICSILMLKKPNEVKMVLIDLKRIELGLYNGIPHLLTPVINDIRKADIALQRLLYEAFNRLSKFDETKTKNIEEYNNYIDNINKTSNDELKKDKLPHILIIIDEVFDLISNKNITIEDSLNRLSQIARQVGIHLIIATQRPSTDIINSLIKSSLLTRVAFKTVSKRDSSIIIGTEGAEDLTSKGDMLYLSFDKKNPIRIKCPYINDYEINKIVDFICQQYTFSTEESILYEQTKKSIEDSHNDPLYNEVVEFVVSTGKASASLIQRKFKIGYNRAAKLIDMLEERGIIGPQNGANPREVLVKIEN